MVVFIEEGDDLKTRENRNFAGKREGRSCPHEDNILRPDINLLSQAFDRLITYGSARDAIFLAVIFRTRKEAAPHHGMFKLATRKLQPPRRWDVESEIHLRFLSLLGRFVLNGFRFVY
jgi:hypothetical protein